MSVFDWFWDLDSERSWKASARTGASAHEGGSPRLISIKNKRARKQRYANEAGKLEAFLSALCDGGSVQTRLQPGFRQRLC